MIRTMKRPLLLAVVFLVLTHLFLADPGLASSNPISFSETQIENHFPEELRFHTTVSTEVREIRTAKLIIALRNDTSARQAIIPVEPAGE